MQKEEQLVTVKKCLLVNNVCQPPSSFILNYNGDVTESLSPSISAKNLEAALNGLSSISSAGSVKVTLESSDTEEKVYRVKFNFDEPETTAMLQDWSQQRGQFVSVSVDKAGISSDKGFRLTIGGKRTQVIHPNATEDELESTFSDLFTTKCEFTVARGKRVPSVEQGQIKNGRLILIVLYFIKAVYFHVLDLYTS